MATGGSGIDRTHDEITVEVILKVLVSVWYNARHRIHIGANCPIASFNISC